MILILAFMALTSASGQNRSPTAPVSGAVVDPRGNAVSDAAVTLRQDAGKAVSSTKSDSSGRFRFAAIAPGSYSLEVRHDGFTISSTQLQINLQPPALLTIALALAPVVT